MLFSTELKDTYFWSFFRFKSKIIAEITLFSSLNNKFFIFEQIQIYDKNIKVANMKKVIWIFHSFPSAKITIARGILMQFAPHSEISTTR